MVDVKPILNAALVAQSASLAGHSLNLVRRKKKKARHFLDAAGTTIIGSSILAAEADLIGGM